MLWESATKSPFSSFTIPVLGWYPFLTSLMPLYKSLILFILLLVSSSLILPFKYAFFALSDYWNFLACNAFSPVNQSWIKLCCLRFCLVVGESWCFVLLFYAGKIKVWWEICGYLPARWGEEILVRTCHWWKKFVSCNGISCELQNALSYKCCYGLICIDVTVFILTSHIEKGL